MSADLKTSLRSAIQAVFIELFKKSSNQPVLMRFKNPFEGLIPDGGALEIIINIYIHATAKKEKIVCCVSPNFLPLSLSQLIFLQILPDSPRLQLFFYKNRLRKEDFS